jgi:hypothetical protein
MFMKGGNFRAFSKTCLTAQTLKKFDQNDSNLAKPNTRETQRTQSNAEEEKGGNIEYCFFCDLCGSAVRNFECVPLMKPSGVLGVDLHGQVT